MQGRLEYEAHNLWRHYPAYVTVSSIIMFQIYSEYLLSSNVRKDDIPFVVIVAMLSLQWKKSTSDVTKFESHVWDDTPSLNLLMSLTRPMSNMVQGK